MKIAIEATPDPARLIRVQVNGRQIEEQTPEIDSGGFVRGRRGALPATEQIHQILAGIAAPLNSSGSCHFPP